MATSNALVNRSKPRSSLIKLAAQINREQAAFEQSLKTGLAHARQAGELLIEAKARMEHGTWLPWLKQNCKVSEWSAQAYMRIARRYSELTKSGTVTDLTLRDGLKLLTETNQIERVMVNVVSSANTERTASPHYQVVTTTENIPLYRRWLPPAGQPLGKADVVATAEPEETTEKATEREFKTELVRLCRDYERDRVETIKFVRDEAGQIESVTM